MLHPLLEKFLTPERSVGPEATDRLGRFLIPLDHVTFEHKIDQKCNCGCNGTIVLAIYGDVIDTHHIGGKWYVKARTAPQFVDIGFDAEYISEAEWCIRMPTPCSLTEHLFKEMVADQNIARFHRYGKLSVNGKEIQCYA